MTKLKELEKYYIELTENDDRLKSMMGMSKIFDLIKDYDFFDDEIDSQKFIVDSVADMNNFIKAKFEKGDVIFMKSLLDQRIAGITEFLKYE